MRLMHAHSKIVIAVSVALVFGVFFLLETFGDRSTINADVTPTISVGNAPHVAINAPITAKSWGVFDVETGAVLGGLDTNVVRPIASVTKLFTAYVILSSASKDVPFEITEEDIATEGRAGNLSAGMTITPYQLLFPILLESSNDAATAAFRAIGALSFDVILDDLFEAISLTETVIVEPTGLSAQNKSSVEELARFFVYLRKEYPHSLDVTQLHTYVAKEGGYVNNNPARAFDTFTGGKQGYTEASQRTFVGSFITEQGEVGIVLLGSADLKADLGAILEAL